MPPLPQDVLLQLEAPQPRRLPSRRLSPAKCGKKGKPCGLTCISPADTCHLLPPPAVLALPPPPPPVDTAELCREAVSEEISALRSVLAVCPTGGDKLTDALKELLEVSDCSCYCKQCEQNAKDIKFMMPIVKAMKTYLDEQGGGAPAEAPAAAPAEDEVALKALQEAADEASACERRTKALEVEVAQLKEALVSAVDNAAAAAPLPPPPVLATILEGPPTEPSEPSGPPIVVRAKVSKASVSEPDEDEPLLLEGTPAAALVSTAVEVQKQDSVKRGPHRNPVRTAMQRIEAILKTQDPDKWATADTDLEQNQNTAACLNWIQHTSVDIAPAHVVARVLAYIGSLYQSPRTKQNMPQTPVPQSVVDHLKAADGSSDLASAKEQATKAVQEYVQAVFADVVGPHENLDQLVDDKNRAELLRFVLYYFGNNAFPAGSFKKADSVALEYLRLRGCVESGKVCDSPAMN